MTVRKLLLQGAAVALAFGSAVAANATTYPVGTNLPGVAYFRLTPETATPNDPVINAEFGATYTSPTTSFDDSFVFTIPQDGFGTGGVTTSFVFASDSLTFTQVYFNGNPLTITTTANGMKASIDLIQILANVQNTIRVVGTVSGTANFTGTAQFAASPVPESATWAMMVVGFGVLGAACRRSRSASTKVSFS